MSVHVEATHTCTGSCTASGRPARRPGVAINPATPLTRWPTIAPDLDIVILYVGQSRASAARRSSSASYDRLRRLRDLLDRTGSPATITVDGGVDPGRAEAVVEAGGDVLVAGAAVFAAPDPAAAIAALRTAGQRGWQARSRR